MAKDINKVIMTGRLGADPESRAMPSGESVCNFRIAVGEQWTDKQSGEKKEKTEWVSITAWGKIGEICQQYLRKGSQVAIVGRFKTRKWQDKQGQDRYTTEVHLDEMTMIGGKPEGATAQASPAQKPAQQAAHPVTAKAGNDWDDDIPFAAAYQNIQQ